MSKRFGDLPREVVVRINSADRLTCEALAERVLDIESPRELLD